MAVIAPAACAGAHATAAPARCRGRGGGGGGSRAGARAVGPLAAVSSRTASSSPPAVAAAGAAAAAVEGGGAERCRLVKGCPSFDATVAVRLGTNGALTPSSSCSSSSRAYSSYSYYSHGYSHPSSSSSSSSYSSSYSCSFFQLMLSSAERMQSSSSFVCASISSASSRLRVGGSGAAAVPSTSTAGRVAEGDRVVVGPKEEEEEEEQEEAVDVVMLGNLCVDVLVDVEELPPNDRDKKWAFMQEVKMRPPDESKWEAGGSLNFAIAAARLGLSVTAHGFLGADVFGSFLVRVLEEEGVRLHELAEGDVGGPLGSVEDGYTGETWVCWVLIDPRGRHSFASPFDFNKHAAFTRLHSLPPGALRLVRRARVLAVNGFAFDELRPEVVAEAARECQGAGGAVFFDTGLRTRSLHSPTCSAKQAFDWLMRECDVLLLTADEAEVITGQTDAVASAEALLAMGGPRRQWVAVKRGAEGCVLATRRDGLFSLPGFKVEVADTVGCGDSFGAAMALGFIRGEPPATALALANAVGAATATRSGAGRNVAEAARVAEILLGLQAREEGWQGNYEDWDADVWLEDKGRRFRLGHVGVHGPATCPSGTPLLDSVRDAARLLHASLTDSLLPPTRAAQSTHVAEAVAEGAAAAANEKRSVDGNGFAASAGAPSVNGRTNGAPKVIDAAAASAASAGAVPVEPTT